MKDLESILIMRHLKAAPRGDEGGSSSVSVIICMLKAMCCSNNWCLLFTLCLCEDVFPNSEKTSGRNPPAVLLAMEGR